MWKKSILDSSSVSTAHNLGVKEYNPIFPVAPKSPVSSQIQKTESFPKPIVQEPKKLTPFKTGPSLLTLENEVEASITDKIQNRIKEIINEKHSPINRNRDLGCDMSNRSNYSVIQRITI